MALKKTFHHGNRPVLKQRDPTTGETRYIKVTEARKMGWFSFKVYESVWVSLIVGIATYVLHVFPDIDDET